ncbi:MAG: hypothetical protein ABIH21_02920 [Patescibacteria group bacterium]
MSKERNGLRLVHSERADQEPTKDPASVEARQEREQIYTERRELLDQWACGVDVNPPWCVFESDERGGFGVTYWIRPGKGADVAAQRISRLTNELGGFTQVRRTEYHPEGEEDTSERSQEVIDSIGTLGQTLSIEHMCLSELEDALRTALINRADGKEQTGWRVYESVDGEEPEMLYEIPFYEDGRMDGVADEIARILNAKSELEGRDDVHYSFHREGRLKLAK